MSRTPGAPRGGYKINEAHALQIIEDPRAMHEIARSFGISETHVCKIKQGAFWPHLDRSNLFHRKRIRPSPTVDGERYHSGEGHSRAKLTDAEAQAIIEDPRTTTEIAAEYDVSRAQVHNIKSGRQWAHLDRSNLVRKRRKRAY